MTLSRALQVLVATLALAYSLRAQDANSTHSPDPFAFPSGRTWRCGFIPLTRADSAKSIGLLYHFAVTEGPPPIGVLGSYAAIREFFVTYDFQEAPLKMTLSERVPRPSGSQMPFGWRLYVIWFGGRAKVAPVGWRGPVLEAPLDPMLDTLVSSKGWTRLSPEEIARAQALSLALRDHACHKPPEPPPQN